MPLRTKLREFLIYFAIQLASYSILTVNVRAIAGQHLAWALATGGLNATLSFWVIRRIAKSEESMIGWLGYVCGSLVGTTLGIYVI